VFRITRNQPWPPLLDLATVRETLAYMRGDMQRVPALDKVAAALDAAILEIEHVVSRPEATAIGPRVIDAKLVARKL
jgi:hypothetical protein